MQKKKERGTETGIILILSCLIHLSNSMSYINRQQIYLPKDQVQEIDFTFEMSYNDEMINATLHIENNWLTTSLPFDVIVTPVKSDVDCIKSNVATCTLSPNITSYTYVKDIEIDFTKDIGVNREFQKLGVINDSKLHVVLINNNKLSPKASYQDLKLDTTFTFEVKKENTKKRNWSLFSLIGVLLLSGILYIRTKNMSNEVKIYDKVLEELEIQMNSQRNSLKF